MNRRPKLIWSSKPEFQLGNRTLIGLFNDRNPRYPDDASLAVQGVPSGLDVSLAFDLFLIGTWDSTGELRDRWVLSLADGTVLVELQRFPNEYRDQEEKKPIGNAGKVQVRNRILDYWVVPQTVTIPSAWIQGNTVTLKMRGYLTGRGTEFWAVSEPKVVWTDGQIK